MVAHEWWGATVGNDPAREPVLDEALANWSALLYYRETYGDEKAATASSAMLAVPLSSVAPTVMTNGSLAGEVMPA